jgi:hypothetical protein
MEGDDRDQRNGKKGHVWIELASGRVRSWNPKMGATRPNKDSFPDARRRRSLICWLSFPPFCPLSILTVAHFLRSLQFYSSTHVL